MTDATAVVVVLVTAPSAEVAETVVQTIVEERLAGCGNIVPGITSIYRWQDAIEREAEVLITFKTVTARLPALCARVQELHPYEVPEIIALPVHFGSEAYMSWVAANASG